MKILDGDRYVCMYRMILGCVLVTAAAPCALAQQAHDTSHMIAFAIGPVWRDTRDYDAARPVGLAESIGFEAASGARHSVDVALSSSQFGDRLATSVNTALADRRPADPHYGSASARVVTSNWDPIEGSRGHSDLTTVDVAVGYRAYLSSSSHDGLYLEGDVGGAYLRSLGEHTIRPEGAALAGYAIKPVKSVGGFVQARFTGMPCDVDRGCSARSPRWLMSTELGISVRPQE